MKNFTKRFALACALLFTAILCMGIVYIDNVKHYWQFSGGFVRLVVNTNVQGVICIDTNTGRFGINTNNAFTAVYILAPTIPTNATGNGTSASTLGRIHLQAATGGSTFDPTSANGAAGGRIIIDGGVGGSAPLAVTNANGGSGGLVQISGGAGGSGSTTVVTTNQSTGGSGGSLTLSGGQGGAPLAPATNTVGGAGGGFTLSAGQGGGPTVGWSRKGGDGGTFQMAGGQGASGTRTNGGAGGAVTIEAGVGGSTSSGGNPGIPGDISLTAGNGGTGDTNANGGSIYLIGGSSSATPGKVVLNRNLSGTVRGQTGIGKIPSERLDVAGNMLVDSNAFYTNLVWLVATNSTANTNLTVDFNQAVQSFYLTNHASLTNWINLNANQSKSVLIFLTASGGPYNLVFPTLGGASFGTRIYTNANSPIWGSITNRLALSITTEGTNAHFSMTEWK